MNRSRGKPIRLRTERFKLRTLGPGDACDNWLRWARDPEVMGPLNQPVRQMRLDQLRSYIASFDSLNRCLIGVFHKEANVLVGFFMVELDHVHGLATFNVLIGEKEWWGKGVVNEVRAALLDHFFKDWKIDKAFGSPLARNFAAVLNYKAQGWRHEGTLRGHRASATGGTRLDQYQFGMLRTDWRATRAKGK